MTAVASVPELTVAQKVLFAAHQLEQQGHSPFSAEALIVASWQASPRTFGLKGFVEQYPDSNRVLSCIMGERGLARQGWLIKVGAKLYTLSDRGRKEITRLEQDQPPEKPAPKPEEPKGKLSKDLEKFLTRVTGTTAVLRFRIGAKQSLTFRDACDFWGVSDPTDSDSVRRAAAKMPESLAHIERQFQGDSIDLAKGRRVSREELKTLLAVHTFLTEHFSRHLNLPRAGHR